MLVLLSCYDTWESGCGWLLFLGSWLFSPGAFLFDWGEGIRKIVFFHVAELFFSHSAVSDSLQLHGLQHARLPCLSPSPGACSNSCPLSQWCHPTISSSLSLLLLPSVFPSIRVFSNESALWFKWPKYWSFSFSISPSNEYSGLIFFRLDWLDLLVVQRTLFVVQLHSSQALVLCVQPSLRSSCRIHTWLLEKPRLCLYRHLLAD